MFEIYNERVRDLLKGQNPPGGLKVRQHPKQGFVVAGLHKVAVSSYSQVRAPTPRHFLPPLRSSAWGTEVERCGSGLKCWSWWWGWVLSGEEVKFCDLVVTAAVAATEAIGSQ